MRDYWLQYVRPDYTQESSKGIDAGTNSLFKTCIGIDTDSWTDTAKERMILPIKNKGYGAREAVDHRGTWSVCRSCTTEHDATG